MYRYFFQLSLFIYVYVFYLRVISLYLCIRILSQSYLSLYILKFKWFVIVTVFYVLQGFNSQFNKQKHVDILFLFCRNVRGLVLLPLYIYYSSYKYMTALKNYVMLYSGSVIHLLYFTFCVKGQDYSVQSHNNILVISLRSVLSFCQSL